MRCRLRATRPAEQRRSAGMTNLAVLSLLALTPIAVVGVLLAGLR